MDIAELDYDPDAGVQSTEELKDANLG